MRGRILLVFAAETSRVRPSVNASENVKLYKKWSAASQRGRERNAAAAALRVTLYFGKDLIGWESRWSISLSNAVLQRCCV